MRKRNRSAKVAQLRARLTPIDLLVFLLAGLLVLAMAGLSGASEWDETLAKAKEEGKFVAVLGGGASRQLRPIFRIFEKKFGIRTVVSTGGGRRQADRILAERGAKKYKADIFMVGTTSGVSRIVRNDAADPIPPVLFLPEVVDKSKWFKGQHFYSDPQQKYLFAFSGRVDRSPIEMRFNTNKLSIKEAKKIDSVWTFLDKRFAGQIVAIPPGPGAGATYFTAMFHPDLGEKYLRRFFSPELNVKFSSDYRLISDGVAKGKYTMAVFAGSAGRLSKKGLPVASFALILERLVKERPTLQGGGAANNIIVLKGRPHPYAAKLFVNWFLSKEGQTLRHTMSDRVPDQTFREDVTEQGKVHKAQMRQPGVDYVTIAHDPALVKKQMWAINRAGKIYKQSRGK
jgi:iron(III) transport system substrate-binding protein